MAAVFQLSLQTAAGPSSISRSCCWIHARSSGTDSSPAALRHEAASSAQPDVPVLQTTWQHLDV